VKKIAYLRSLLLLSVIVFLSGCKTELYSHLSEREGNEMLAVLLSEGVSAEKKATKDNTVQLLVDDSQVAYAIEVLKRKGYPRERFSSLKDIFPEDGLIASPTAERARLIYAVSQDISATLSQIDGVLSARVHVVLPTENDSFKKEENPASASVFIKHASDAPLEPYIPQIKLLVNNSIEGLNYDKISVVLFPSSDIRLNPDTPQFENFLSVKVTKDTKNNLMIGFVLLILLLVGSNVGQYLMNRNHTVNRDS